VPDRNPAVSVPDLIRLIGKDGGEQPVAAAPPRPGHIPAGPREPYVPVDWLRASLRRCL
jgi:hypothetical protein